jgi:glycosyltransferase involved in cell wall biosynthesis
MGFIYLQQVVIPDYRLPLFLLLKKSIGDQFDVFAGETDYNITPQSTPIAWDHFHKVNNHYLLNHRLVWQGGLFRKLVSADLLIASANMRNLTVVSALIFRKVLRRKTILWGHAKGQTRIGSLLRGLFLRKCNHFIAYTQSQATYLTNQYPWLKVTAAPNACVHVKDCYPLPVPASEVQNVLYVGRLVPEKKPGLLLKGFHHAVINNFIPHSAKLIFIGAGPEKIHLMTVAQKLNIQDRVEFLGHISDVDTLRCHYSRTVCSASPGPVGLAATQSFCFGIPMLLGLSERHGPEIEACQQDYNADFFESDNPQALAEGLKNFYDAKDLWLAKRSEICEGTKSKYTYESMRDRFLEVIESVSS